MNESSQTKTASWTVLAMLSVAQFIMVLELMVMNVSISEVVNDLNTTVVGFQTAVTLFTLVMAAFMLIGGKLGDRWGAKKAFTIGLLIYGTGSLVTTFAPSLGVLIISWSLIEALGAVLVVPAIAGLTAATYQGQQRIMAFAILGGVAGGSAALGSLIGGWITTNLSWRLVFASEAVIVLVLLVFLRALPTTPGRAAKLDLGGAFLSAAGLGLAVFGILFSSQWGWIAPKPAAPFTPLGLSPVVWLIVSGGILLALFVLREEAVIAAGHEPLLDIRLLGIPQLKVSMILYTSQQFIIQATLFVLPLYLQTVLGYDSMQTGVSILPLSLGLFVFALIGGSLSTRFMPKRIVQAGVIGMIAGLVLLIAFTGPKLDSLGFALALAVVGAGFGLLISELANLIMSSVSPERGSEVGGMQGTAQGLGASLGTALIGSILIASLVINFQDLVLANPALADVSGDITIAAGQNEDFASVEVVRTSAVEAGLPPVQVAAVTAHYAESQITALKVAFTFLALAGLASLWYVRRLPGVAHAKDPVDVQSSPLEPSSL